MSSQVCQVMEGKKVVLNPSKDSVVPLAVAVRRGQNVELRTMHCRKTSRFTTATFVLVYHMIVSRFCAEESWLSLRKTPSVLNDT